MKKKTVEPTVKALIIFLSAILFIALSVFLNGKDCAECYTGWQILGMKGYSFWLWAVFFTGLSVYLIHRIVKYVNASGGVGVSITVLIPVAIFLSIAWGGVCTDKANNGVTTEKYKPKGPLDDGREAAEDQIKK